MLGGGKGAAGSAAPAARAARRSCGRAVGARAAPRWSICACDYSAVERQPFVHTSRSQVGTCSPRARRTQPVHARELLAFPSALEGHVRGVPDRGGGSSASRRQRLGRSAFRPIRRRSSRRMATLLLVEHQHPAIVLLELLALGASMYVLFGPYVGDEHGQTARGRRAHWSRCSSSWSTLRRATASGCRLRRWPGSSCCRAICRSRRRTARCPGHVYIVVWFKNDKGGRRELVAARRDGPPKARLAREGPRCSPSR